MDIQRLLYEMPTDRLRRMFGSRISAYSSVPHIQDKADLTRFLAGLLHETNVQLLAMQETNLLEIRIIILVISREDGIYLQELLSNASVDMHSTVNEAVENLIDKGLLFKYNSNSQPKLYALPGIRDNALIPLPFRVTIKRALQKESAAVVGLIHSTLGLADGLSANIASRIADISREMSQPERVQFHAGKLGEAERKILQFVLDAGGAVTLPDIGTLVDARQRNQLYTYDWSHRWAQGKPRNPVEALMSHALLVQRDATSWGSGYIVAPYEVYSAMRPFDLFGPGYHGIPEFAVSNTESNPLKRHETIERDITYLLGFISRVEAVRSNKGSIYRNSLKALAKGFTDASMQYAEFLYSIAREAGLIDANDHTSVYAPTEFGMEWLGLPREEQRKVLFSTWYNQMRWNEVDSVCYAEDPMVYHLDTTQKYRSTVIELLADMTRRMDSSAVTFKSLSEQARFRWWSMYTAGEGKLTDTPKAARSRQYSLPIPGAMLFIKRVAANSLYWLGLTQIQFDSAKEPIAACLTPLGRKCFLREEIDDASIDYTEKFVVQPNLEIYAPPNLTPKHLYRLFRIAEPNGAGMMTLTRDSLRKAMDYHDTSRDIVAFIKEHSQTGIPQNVEYLINEVGERHGHIKVGQAGLFIQVRDPVLLKELSANPKLSVHIQEHLSDTIALVSGDNMDSVLKQLRQAGYFPIAQTDKTTRKPRPKPAPKHERAKTWFEEEKTKPTTLIDKIDWNAIAREDGKPFREVGTTTDHEDSVARNARQDNLYKIINKAILQKRLLHVCFTNKGSAIPVEAIIEPATLVNRNVKAYSRTLKTVVTIQLDGIQWVKPVAED